MTCHSKLDGGWVVWNLKNPKCISSYTGNYETIIPREVFKTLTKEQVIKAVAKIGEWSEETLSIRNGEKDIWGKEWKNVYIISRKAVESRGEAVSPERSTFQLEHQAE